MIFFFLLNFKELISVSQLAADNAAAAAAKSLQLRLSLWDPIDGSSPGSPISGILQARTLEWVAISSSSAWKRKEKVKLLSHVRLFTTPWTAAYLQAPLSMGFSRQEYWSGLPLPSLAENDMYLINIWVLSSPLYLRCKIWRIFYRLASDTL